MDFEMAAMLYRSCRRGGTTPRKMVDCLIAAIAIRSGSPILHADRDFDLLAQHTKLAIA
jgi:predicted nucleic acid-binding protein